MTTGDANPAAAAAEVLLLLADHKDAQAEFRKLHILYHDGQIDFRNAGPLFQAGQARRVELESQFISISSQHLRDLAAALATLMA